MDKRFWRAVIATLLVSSGAVSAQTVPHNDARIFSETVQVENQWTDQRTDVRTCQVERLGKPFFHLKTPDGGHWEGTSDPGEAYVRAEDICGARFANLSGVYRYGGTQYIVSHDPRSGRIEIRYLYVPPNEEPRKTWAIGLGWTDAEGRIHADDMWLNANGIFPPNYANTCPEQFLTSRRAPVLSLGRFEVTDDDGKTRLRRTIAFSWPRLRISSSCDITYMEANHIILEKLDLQP